MAEKNERRNLDEQATCKEYLQAQDFQATVKCPTLSGISLVTQKLQTVSAKFKTVRPDEKLIEKALKKTRKLLEGRKKD